MATPIKELNPGDDFTGKLNVSEYDIEGDTITMRWVEIKGESGTLKDLVKRKEQVENDIAYRQNILASLNARISLLTAEPEPAPVEK